MLSQIANSLVPLFLLIILGAVLAARGFLKDEFLNQLNKVVYWIALPSVIVGELSVAEFQGGPALRVFSVIVAVTVVGGLIAVAIAWIMRVPVGKWGTISQAAFRGNLALVGIPVLIYDLSQRSSTALNPDGSPVVNSEEVVSIALLVLGMTMLLYNVLSVIVLLASYNHSGDANVERVNLQKLMRQMGQQIATNPLILAALLGSLLSLIELPPPAYVLGGLKLAGQLAVPAALICIGARLGTTKFGSHMLVPAATALVKVGIIPVVAWLFATWWGIEGEELGIVMIFAACPTAVASYIMAVEMHGDPDIASGTIALSTLFSAVSLAVALVFF